MKPTFARPSRHATERGVAAVEFALLLPLLVVLLAAPLYLGRVFWHYTAAQKAAHDAAQYLSMVSDLEMRSPALTPPAIAVARDIVTAELADLYPGTYPPAVTVECDGVACNGFAAPTTVRVNVQMLVQDPFFSTAYGGDEGMLITADAQMRYIGAK